MKLTIEEHHFLNDWLEEWEKRFQNSKFGNWNLDGYWRRIFCYENHEIRNVISQVRNAKSYIHSTSTESKQKQSREKLIALTFIAEFEIDEFEKTGKLTLSLNNDVWNKWLKQSEETPEKTIKQKNTVTNKYSLGEPPITFEESLQIPVHGEESLFCDTEFLESFFKKPIKKSKECK